MDASETEERQGAARACLISWRVIDPGTMKCSIGIVYMGGLPSAIAPVPSDTSLYAVDASVSLAFLMIIREEQAPVESVQ
jgi:hypothetical protein